ncbi:Transcription factor, FAR1-related protein [Ophiocordyceps camponoti-floridani]|uniref:Transcription factor, FAR1-related protein n=1 Tax=Ophiocordyceps camponoti-floridani TaxID=2030778 RepID=A0A8H4QC69_9HYPO|nr:Transcription factor, FAR1-related protein [Ophiocordyceps camponoti-floridani]
MFGILEAVSVPHSGVYASCEDLMRDLNSRAEKEGYKIVKARSDRSRPGGPIIRADLVCERGGRPYRCQATKHKTSTKKTNCPWKAKAVDRKLLGGWVLTIICDHHNHEPGTPEPPTPSEGSDVGEEETTVRPEGPRPDDETAVALQVAGVSDAVLRLSGDTFHRFKGEYRKMSQPERLGILAQMQLRIAAIYAVQNEDMQRQKRQDAQDKRHREIEENKRRLEAGGLHSAKRLRGVPPAPSADESPSGGGTGQRQYSRIAPAPGPVIQEPHFQPVSGITAEPTPQMSFQAYPGPPKRRRQSRTAAAATAQQPQQQQQSGQQPAQQQVQHQSQQQQQSQQQHPEPLATGTNAAVQVAESAKS